MDLGILDILKLSAEFLFAPLIAVVSYIFNDLRKTKDTVAKLELKIAEKYLTKQEFREFEAKIFDKIDEHKEESVRQHTDISNKISSLDSKLFSVLTGKSIDKD